MGLFDRLRIEDGADVTLPAFEGDPTTITWQTKSLRPPAMEHYKITMDGRLFEEDATYETVPPEERPLYDEELGGFESEMAKLCGMCRKRTEGWSDTEFHGIVEFHAVVDGEGFAYEAKFTDGDLVDVCRVERW